MNRFHCLLLLLPVLAIGPPAASSASRLADSDVIVADFERGARPIELGPANMTVTITPDEAGRGRYLRMQPRAREGGKSYLRLRLPDDVNPAGKAHLSAELRAPGAEDAIVLRWLALDEKGRPIFQRRVELKPGDDWVRLEQPLRTWHWDTRRVGDWDEVRELALRVDSDEVERIDLDDVTFGGLETEADRVEWLLELAFADRPREVARAEDDDLLVATDAVEAYDEADLRSLLEDMRRARKFIRRIFGDAVRPTDDLGAPAALLIFEDRQDYTAFSQRLGEAWDVTVTPPRGQGYTVQDISTSTYDPKQGPRRPVYLHESIHTIVARDLRLLTGNAPHTPLHEGLASYVQICVYPDSIDRKGFTEHFAGQIDPSGKGFFKPLEMLFAKRATTSEYAQLASVVAYLVENDPELLRDLAKGLADGSTASEVLARRGPTWGELQERWLNWGRERFVENRNPNAPLFDPPAEFRSK